MSDVGGCTAIFMEKAAHHLDLRLPNAADSVSVIAGRAKETTIIKSWIQQYTNENLVSKSLKKVKLI